MKIFYISSVGTKQDPYSSYNKGLEFDLDRSSSVIIHSIKSLFSDIEISSIQNSSNITVDYYNQFAREYDLFICDLTTCNANILFLAGIVEGLGKPIIYIGSNISTYPIIISSSKVLLYSDSSLESAFIEKIIATVQLAIDDPKAFSQQQKESVKKPKAFICYSHSDNSYLDRLMIHLKPLAKKGIIDVWADKNIKTGDKWEQEIKKALEESSIAILLISADFMASDFIIENELPPLLTDAEVKGTKILPIIVSPCRFSREGSLNQFQSINSPNEPLSTMNYAQRESIYDQLAYEIESALISV